MFQHVIEVNDDSAGSDDSASSSSSDSDSSILDCDQEIEYMRRHADILANERFREIDAAYHAEVSASESESKSRSINTLPSETLRVKRANTTHNFMQRT